MELIKYLEFYLKDKAETEPNIRVSVGSAISIVVGNDVEERRSRQLLVDIATMIYAYDGKTDVIKISLKRIGNVCIITIKTN